ncbi:MAG: peptide deformylase [bacterium]|nr:peptide deformylase [bacterium]
MPKQLRLRTLPSEESTLRGKNLEIQFPLSAEILDLIEDMKLTVKKAPGIGLAAPQVGKNLMLAIINLEELGVKPFAIINPRVISKSIKKTEMDEGCLSMPGQFGPVRRPAKVEVSAYNEQGKKVLIKAGKLLAKVLQHEIDHLNAVLIIDKMEK